MKLIGNFLFGALKVYADNTGEVVFNVGGSTQRISFDEPIVSIEPHGGASRQFLLTGQSGKQYTINEQLKLVA